MRYSVKFKGDADDLWIRCLWSSAVDLGSEGTLEERKALVLMKLRGYKKLKREELPKNIISFLVSMPKIKKKALLWCVVTEATVGVQYINQMNKAMKEAEVERAIVVTSGRYTQAAKVKAKKNRIELIPRIFPSFDIFDHVLVPKHEILTPEERQEILAKFKVEAYQLPQIKISDPAVRAIGARPGDIVRVLRDSATAGLYVAYRYVVEG